LRQRTWQVTASKAAVKWPVLTYSVLPTFNRPLLKTIGSLSLSSQSSWSLSTFLGVI